MANLNVAGLSLNPDEVTETSQIIVEKAFIDTPLAKFYDIQTGISHDQSIVFLASMGITGKAITNCSPEEIGGLVFTEKFWTPKLIGGKKTHCANDENQLNKWLKQAKNVYNDFFDRTGSPELQMIVSVILMSMIDSIPAKAWFSDTEANDIAGGGVFGNGTDLGLFNQFDGLWKQIVGDVNVPVTAIAKNAEATYAAQKLVADEAITILDNLLDSADSRLVNSPDAQLYVTGDVYRNFKKSIRNIQYNGGITEVLENGKQSLSIDGIPIYEEKIFDHVIKNYQNDGTKHNQPHRIVLTTKGNIPIGTLSTSDLQNLRSVFDEPNNTNILEFAYFLDAKFGESYMAAVAY